MKKNHFYNFSFTHLLILIILKTDAIETVLKTCDIRKLQTFGVKTHCESKMEETIACVGPNIKKVYLECKDDYFSADNLKIKTVYCNNDGEWSDKPLLCTPKCTEFLNKLELIDTDKLKFPTAYVEFSKMEPIDGKINRFPGIILSERQILTTNFSHTEGYNLIIFKSGGKIIKIDYRLYQRTANGGFIILGPHYLEDFYIKYDADTKPACKNISDILHIPQVLYQNYDISSDYYTPLLHMCYVPKIDNTKVNKNCITYENAVSSIKCFEMVIGVKLRCQLGYKNYNLNHDSDTLSKCLEGKWEVFGEEDDCQLVCGQIAGNIQPYAIKLLYKGNTTDIVNAPWHVGIYANNTGTLEFEQICGGSIIHSNVVISAAHCFYDDSISKLFSTTDYLIGAGKTYRSIGASDEFALYIDIKEIHIPLHYQSAPVRNDIAVLILKSHFQYSTYIKPVCIDWDPRQNYDTTIGVVKGRVVGWGATSINATSSSKLLELNFETMDNSACRKLVHPKYRSEITGDKFCAQNMEGGTACQGDSGGGFFIEKYVGYQKRYFLVGVVSLGINRDKYCSDGFITMFTNVKLYKDFIQQAISKNIKWYSPDE